MAGTEISRISEVYVRENRGGDLILARRLIKKEGRGEAGWGPN